MLHLLIAALVFLTWVGSASATDISSCTTINSPGVYRLTANLTSVTDSCIDITASNVTFDGQGFTIDSAGGGDGVYAYGGGNALQNVTVRNLLLTGWHKGVYFYNVASGTIENNTIRTGTFGVYLSSNTNTNISHNIVYSNSRSGIYLWSVNSYNTVNGNTVYSTVSSEGNGIHIEPSNHHNTFVNNVLYSNFANGIYSRVSNYNTYINNTAYSNGQAGISISEGSSYSTLVNNTAYSNYAYGIWLTGTGNTVVNNKLEENGVDDFIHSPNGVGDCNAIIRDNTGSGGRPIEYFNSSVNLQNKVLAELILCNADGSNISNLTIAGSDTLKNNGIFAYYTDNTNFTNIESSGNSYGISIHSGVNNFLTNNTANSNDVSGISLGYYSSGALSNNTALGNYIGISVYSNSLLRRNNASDNEFHGIFLRSASGNTAEENTARHNKFSGLYFYQGPFSGNTIISNNLSDNGAVGIYAWSYGLTNATLMSTNTITGNDLTGNKYPTYILGIAPGFRNCMFCHIEKLVGTVLGVPQLNHTSFSSSPHFQLNNITVNENGACWACHNNGSAPENLYGMGTNTTLTNRPWRCPDCHTPGGSQYGKYPAPAVANHLPDNLTFYSASIETNASNAYCPDCHQNSIGDTGGTQPDSLFGTPLIANVSHYVTTDRLVANTAQNCTYCHKQPNGSIRVLWRTNTSPGGTDTAGALIGNLRHPAGGNTSDYCSNCHNNHGNGTLHSPELYKYGWPDMHYAFDWLGDDATSWWGPGDDWESCDACHIGATANKICEDCHVINSTLGNPNGPNTNIYGGTLRSDFNDVVPKVFNHINASKYFSGIKIRVPDMSGRVSGSSRSSCFDYNTGSDEGVCHGVSWFSRSQAGNYSAHGRGEGPGSAGGPFMFNNPIDDLPKTNQCLFCHNQRIDSVWNAWGRAIRIYYNRSNQSQYIGPSLMYGATDNSDCYTCHTSDNAPPKDFHADTITAGGGPECISCHGINYPGASPSVPTKYMFNISAFSSGVHLNINATPPDTASNEDCWRCHYEKDMDRSHINPCWNCHNESRIGNILNWHSGTNMSVNLIQLIWGTRIGQLAIPLY